MKMMALQAEQASDLRVSRGTVTARPSTSEKKPSEFKPRMNKISLKSAPRPGLPSLSACAVLKALSGNQTWPMRLFFGLKRAGQKESFPSCQP